MTGYFTASDGARLAYLDEGEGLALLCLAGLTRTKEDFDPALPALQGCRVIRMDYRGRGESDYTGAASYSLPRESQDALELMDHLGIARFALLGTSRGGLIGLGLARFHKERLLGLCLNDIGPEIERAGLEAIATRIGKTPQAASLAEMAELLGRTPGFAGVTDEAWRAMAGRLYHSLPGGGLKARYDPALREAFLAALNDPAPPPDLWPFWQATDPLPVALIRGAHSDLLSQATAARMLQIRPDTIFAEIPDRAHVPFLDEEAAQAALRAWLEKMR
ncbi:alpha/beta fold hydrolase [Pseudogemmobacter faecipullorum]|uniref:Alpha/beta fold hydrolase n=1 Tax=Pseudogemmobacter faecipullorum TaxID=2755041 RepID=A0ABS8CLF2_9RHOB|nr:alpha/beta fold hydrolase [Pseudogemmobacter faecipullorum]